MSYQGPPSGSPQDPWSHSDPSSPPAGPPPGPQPPVPPPGAEPGQPYSGPPPYDQTGYAYQGQAHDQGGYPPAVPGQPVSGHPVSGQPTTGQPGYGPPLGGYGGAGGYPPGGYPPVGYQPGGYQPGGYPSGGPYPGGQVQMPTTSDERTMAMLAHLLSIFFGWLGALIIYLMKKDESRFVRHHAAEALNLNLTALIVSLGVSIVGCILTFVVIGVFLFLLLIPYGIALLVFMIIAAMAANRGEMYSYPAWLRIPMVK